MKIINHQLHLATAGLPGSTQKKKFKLKKILNKCLKMMYKMFGIKVYAMEVGNLMTIVCCDLLIVSGFVCLHKPWFSVSLV